MKTPSAILIISLSTLFWEASGHRPINFQPPGCNRRCPFNYDPVCGTDGKTYANMCTLVVARRCDNVNVRRRHPGECGSTNTNCNPNAGCPFNYAPICGSDGQTYANDCVFRNAVCRNPGLRKVSDGECGSTNQNCRPSVGCPFNYAPVCGSDGQTYSNLCTFQNAACNVPNLVKVSDGECGSTNSNCRQRVGCPFNLAPVCGSNGQTYPNECVFQNAVCSDPTLTKVSDGECGNGNGNGNGNPNCRPSQICPLNYSPICGSDGKTYGNECDFRNAACNNPRLEQLFSGECGSQRPNCPQICPANYVPVCGSDGRTYGNACNLGVASCNNPSIRKVSDGECGFMGRIMSFIQNNL